MKSPRRCMWYNKHGWPRVNPALEAKKVYPPLGCQHGADCRFVHPTDENWKGAGPSEVPATYYKDGIRPSTPEPDYIPTNNRRFRRPATPEKNDVKKENLSPRISFDRDDSILEIRRNGERRKSRSRSRDRSLGRREESSVRSSSRGRTPPHFQPHRETEDPKEWTRDRMKSRSNSNSLLSRMGKIRTNDSNSPLSAEPKSRLPNDTSFRDKRRGSIASNTSTHDDHSHNRPSLNPNGGRRQSSQDRPRPRKDDSPMYSPRSRPPAPLTRLPDSATSQVSFSMPPPPTPTDPTPPTPRAPSFTPIAPIAPKNELNVQLSSGQRRDRWTERIRLLAEASRARMKYDQLKSELATLKKLASAERTERLPQTVHDRIDQSLRELSDRCDEARKKAEDHVDLVVASDFWPVNERKSLTDSVIKDKELRDLQDSLQQEMLKLSADINRIDGGLKELTSWVGSRPRAPLIAPPPLPPPPSSGMTLTTTIPRRASEDWETPAAKRRRVESDDPPAYDSDSRPGFAPATSSSGTTLVAGNDSSNDLGGISDEASKVEDGEDSKAASDIDMAKLKKLLRNCQERVAELENGAAQTHEEIQDLVTDQVDAALEKMEERMVEEKDSRRKLKDRFKQMMKTLEGYDHEIREISDNVAQLYEMIPTTEDVVATHERLKTIDAEVKLALEESRLETERLRNLLQEAKDDHKMLETTIKIQQERITKPIPPTHPSPPTTPPPPPSTETIFELIMSRVIDAVRADLMPLLSDHRSTILQNIKSYMLGDDLIRGKVEKIALVPQAVQSLMENQQDAGVVGANANANANGTTIEGAAKVNGDHHLNGSTVPPTS